MALKNQVQALKNAGYVSFGYDKVGGPNVTRNPLPNHSGLRLMMFWKALWKEGRKTYIGNVITPMRVICEELVQIGFFQSRRGEVVKEERLNKGYY